MHRDPLLFVLRPFTTVIHTTPCDYTEPILANPVYATSATNHVNIIAELEATLIEHEARGDDNTKDVSNILVGQHESRSPSIINDFLGLRLIVAFFIPFLSTVVFVCLCVYIGACRCLYCLVRNVNVIRNFVTNNELL